jgi:peptide/nickel transport system permease protein
MIGYLVRRVGQALVVVVGVTIITVLLYHLLPGNPARAILGPRATAQQLQAFDVANGFNRPIYIQYLDWVDRLLHGNLGYSYQLNQSVTSLLSERLPKTLILVGVSYFLALVIAIPLGLFQASRRSSFADYVVTGSSFVLYSMPTFWLGQLMIILLAVDLHAFPAEAPQGTSLLSLISDPVALVLPVATLTMVTVALFSRYMRSSTIENLTQDYVRTARSKGVGPRRVLFGHILRNALIPIATLIGLSLPAILSGALVTESVFNYPGMGLLFFQAAVTRDYPVLIGVIVVVAIAAVLGSLLADILYAVLDPRVRYVPA